MTGAEAGKDCAGLNGNVGTAGIAGEAAAEAGAEATD